MPERNRDVGAVAGLVAAGLIVPLVVAALGHETLQLYLSGLAFTIIVAVAFTVVAWLAIDAWALDRVNVAVAAILVPAGFFLATILLAMLGVLGDGLRDYLFGGIPGLFRYAGLFAVAGLGAVALSRRLRERDRVPDPRKLAAGGAVATLLAATLLAGVNYAGASSAAVAAVEPGTLDHDKALNVTVAGPPAELRVAVVAPGGHTVRKRLSRGEMAGGSGTVAIPVWFDATPPPDTLPIRSGGYEVRVQSLLGATVASERYAVEGEPTPTVTAVRTSVGPIDWPAPLTAAVHQHPVNETRIGVAVANDTPFPAEYSLALLHSGSGPTPTVETEIAPGDQVGLVVDLPPGLVEHLESAQDGRATLVLSRSHEPVLVRRVTLPAA